MKRTETDKAAAAPLQIDEIADNLLYTGGFKYLINGFLRDQNRYVIKALKYWFGVQMVLKIFLICSQKNI